MLEVPGHFMLIQKDKRLICTSNRRSAPTTYRIQSKLLIRNMSFLWKNSTFGKSKSLVRIKLQLSSVLPAKTIAKLGKVHRLKGSGKSSTSKPFTFNLVADYDSLVTFELTLFQRTSEHITQGQLTNKMKKSFVPHKTMLSRNSPLFATGPWLDSSNKRMISSL